MHGNRTYQQKSRHFVHRAGKKECIIVFAAELCELSDKHNVHHKYVSVSTVTKGDSMKSSVLEFC